MQIDSHTSHTCQQSQFCMAFPEQRRTVRASAGSRKASSYSPVQATAAAAAGRPAATLTTTLPRCSSGWGCCMVPQSLTSIGRIRDTASWHPAPPTLKKVAPQQYFWGLHRCLSAPPAASHAHHSAHAVPRVPTTGSQERLAAAVAPRHGTGQSAGC
jgi:hypothetical protein